MQWNEGESSSAFGLAAEESVERLAIRIFCLRRRRSSPKKRIQIGADRLSLAGSVGCMSARSRTEIVTEVRPLLLLHVLGPVFETPLAQFGIVEAAELADVEFSAAFQTSRKAGQGHRHAREGDAALPAD